MAQHLRCKQSEEVPPHSSPATVEPTRQTNLVALGLDENTPLKHMLHPRKTNMTIEKHNHE